VAGLIDLAIIKHRLRFTSTMTADGGVYEMLQSDLLDLSLQIASNASCMVLQLYGLAS
jgi:hypothetical protein